MQLEEEFRVDLSEDEIELNRIFEGEADRRDQDGESVERNDLVRRVDHCRLLVAPRLLPDQRTSGLTAARALNETFLHLRVAREQQTDLQRPHFAGRSSIRRLTW